MVKTLWRYMAEDRVYTFLDHGKELERDEWICTQIQNLHGFISDESIHIVKDLRLDKRSMGRTKRCKLKRYREEASSTTGLQYLFWPSMRHGNSMVMIWGAYCNE